MSMEFSDPEYLIKKEITMNRPYENAVSYGLAEQYEA